MTPLGTKDIFLTVRGLRLHLLDWGGGGPPLFFTHANGYLAALWHPIAREFTPRMRVLGIDVPGCGDSEPASDYNWSNLADYVAEALQALDLGPYVLCGHSMGGAFSAICAARYHGLVRGLVLADPVVLPQPFYAKPEAAESSDFYGARRRRRTWASREEMRESLRSKMPYVRWRPEPFDLFVQEGVRDTEDGVTLKCSPETEVDIYRNTLSYDLWPEIAHAGVPAVVLRGTSKEGYPSVTAPELPGWLPQGEDRPMPDASHHLPMEFPEAVITALNDLLPRLES